MKQLLLLLTFLFLFSTIKSQSEFITYIEGKDPIIILATHGGNQYTKKITNRDCGKHVCVSDLYTDDLALESNREMKNNLVYPHILVMNLDREEIDLNRPLEEACNDLTCAIVYNKYHEIIRSIIRSTHDKVLILDIHGHGHSHSLIGLGYDIPRHNYTNLLDNTTPSSLNAVNTDNFDQLIRGLNSFGSYLNSYNYFSTPSIYHPIPPVEYFNGGYITEEYSKYKNVAVIQVELPYYIRKNKKSRSNFLLYSQ